MSNATRRLIWVAVTIIQTLGAHVVGVLFTTDMRKKAWFIAVDQEVLKAHKGHKV